MYAMFVLRQPRWSDDDPKGATHLSWVDGADATDARADKPGRETFKLFGVWWYCGCLKALEDCVEVEDGREISCPRGGSVEEAISCETGVIEKDGRLCIGCGEGSRRVGSTGMDPWTMGGSIRAVVAVACS